MKKIGVLISLLCLLWLLFLFPPQIIRAAVNTPTPTLDGQELTISSPVGGEALQGLVVIMGTAKALNFISMEVSFAYQKDPTQTWFLIGQSSLPIDQGILANWDTTTISDGYYRIRVLLYLSDGKVIEKIIEGIRVRNYSPVETSTPGSANAEPTLETFSQVVTITPTNTPMADLVLPERTPVPQDVNPVQVNALDLVRSFGVGAAVVVGMLCVGGLYIGLTWLFKRK